MYSVENKNYHIAKLLLQKGADINKRDVDGFSCLMIAIDCNDSNFFKLLLDYNPTIEVL
jgi:ankyrin repeat protein